MSTEINVDQVIAALRGTDRYATTIYMQGGCYQFHLFLKAIWPNALPVINDKMDHVMTLIDGDAYDITGKTSEAFRAMDDDDVAMAQEWSFGANSLLTLPKDCVYCGEPLMI